MKNSLQSSMAFLLVFFLFFTFPIEARADASLSINKWMVASRILENGDLEIIEDISFDFDGKFNGVFREIILGDTDGIDNLQLGQVLDGGEISFTQVASANKGDDRVYLLEEEGDKINIKIFSPSRNQEKTFRLRYTIKNVAVGYDDTAELYYKFLGQENTTPIKEFLANIQLPQAREARTKIFAHGPLHGNINFIEDDLVQLKVVDVPKDTFVEARILFPTNFIPASTNIVNQKAYDEIMKKETSYAKAIEDRQIQKAKIKNTFTYLSLLVSGLMAALLSFISSKFRRSSDIFQGQDYSPYPQESTPALAAYLTGNGPSTSSLMATIYDLARKGFISIENLDDLEEPEEFQLNKIQEGDDSLLSHEVFLMEWLFDQIGDGLSVTTDAIEEYGKKHSSKFATSYHNWIKKVKKNAHDQGYYDDKGKGPGILLIVLSIISFLFGIFALIAEAYYGFLLIVVASLSFIYGIKYLYRKSDFGYLEFRKWQDFKKELRLSSDSLHLDDFSFPLDISLIYGLALGVNSKHLKKFKALTPASSMPNHWMYWYYATGSKGQNSFQSSLNNSFSSSNFGGGGGFSAGGGGGAGGGGAGGF